MNVMKLFDVYHKYATKGELGVEIEVEGANLPRLLKYWKIEHDGSLEDGKEYVLNKPYTLLGVRQAILEMKRAVLAKGSKFNDSIRAGVHVHVNMQECTKAQLYNTVVMWSIFEEVLLNRCGKHRKGNLFCLPLNSSENVIRALRNAATEDHRMFGLASEEYRYCAMNVCSLGKYGSLEFRAMRTDDDLEITYEWAKLLLNMKNVACKYKNPLAIMEELQEEGGVRTLYNKVFSKSLSFLGPQPNLESLVGKSILAASSIAYASDWVVKTVPPKAKEERKPGIKAAPIGWAMPIYTDEVQNVAEEAEEVPEVKPVAVEEVRKVHLRKAAKRQDQFAWILE